MPLKEGDMHDVENRMVALSHRFKTQIQRSLCCGRDDDDREGRRGSNGY